MRCSPIICLGLLLVAGCPRDYPHDAARAQATASHPWELPGYSEPGSAGDAPPAAGEPFAPALVDLPAIRGPALPAEDSFDPALLAGRWLQVCQVMTERLQLIPVGQMDLLDLWPDGSAAYQLVTDFETEVREGTWRKPEPGVLAVAIERSELPFYGQLYRGNFLYIWSYEDQQGFWFVRLPRAASERFQAASFLTDRGVLQITQVVQQGYKGEVRGAGTMTVSGFYVGGVLTMRWEDEENNAAGYAAFLVDPEWETLTGVWWLDDYQAAPFGGDWDGTAQ